MKKDSFSSWITENFGKTSSRNHEVCFFFTFWKKKCIFYFSTIVKKKKSVLFTWSYFINKTVTKFIWFLCQWKFQFTSDLSQSSKKALTLKYGTLKAEAHKDVSANHTVYICVFTTDIFSYFYSAGHSESTALFFWVLTNTGRLPENSSLLVAAFQGSAAWVVETVLLWLPFLGLALVSSAPKTNYQEPLNNMISQFTCTDDCWHSDWIGVIDGETAAKLAKRPKFLLNEAAESWRACKESVFGMPVH